MFTLVLTAVGLAAMVGLALFAVRAGRSVGGELDRRFEAQASLFREESRRDREELRSALAAALEPLQRTLRDFTQAQADQLGAMRKEGIDGREASDVAQARRATDALQAQTAFGERLEAAIAALTKSNAENQKELREALTTNLDKLRAENGEKLEQMRATVDEKLHESLEKRLGESFKQVSERLELVHTGLGEMRTLASGVGDLKRVLTNVKSRGSWGEVQLGMLLDDLLTPDQYLKNTRIRPESGEVVEFAIRLPGSKEGAPLLLPIDCKFPHEDYERLVAAQDAGLAEEVERYGAALERAVRLQARSICDKYVHPPHSTDFAILYLPTEGLFAEVVRRPGLAGEIQAAHRVMLTGPTTLAALLTSLQMGFRTLAIEKRSSEVWQVLGAAKSEFQKYGQVWNKLSKQLEAAQNTVTEAGRRTRAVERKLRDVESVEIAGVEPLLLEDDSEDIGEAA